MPWLTDIARRFEALAADDRAPGPDEYAKLLHGLVGVGQLMSQIAIELRHEQAALERRALELAAHEAQQQARADEAQAASEELLNLLAIAEARIVALRRVTER